jgi:hypothetical protein
MKLTEGQEVPKIPEPGFVGKMKEFVQDAQNSIHKINEPESI